MEQPNETKAEVNNDIALINQKLDYLVKEAKAASITRKITIILAVVFVVLPAILMVFVLPTVIGSITSTYSSL